MSRGHREVDHSGDVCVEAWAATRAHLLEEATLGLLELTAAGPVTPAVERALTASAHDDQALLVDWLNEVILAGALHGEVYSRVRVDACDGSTVRGSVFGATADDRMHRLRFDVKAATYHGLVFERTEAGYRARVIFDL